MQTHSSPNTTSAKHPFRQFILASATVLSCAFIAVQPSVHAKELGYPEKEELKFGLSN